MKTFLSFALAFVLVGASVPAYAAMPNYTGTDYKQAEECTINDRLIYEMVDGQTVVTGCLTPEAWSRAMAEAARRQSSGFFFEAGQTVMLKNGSVDTCPLWFGMGCAILPELLR